MGKLREIADRFRPALVVEEVESLVEFVEELNHRLGELAQDSILALVLDPGGRIVHLSPGLRQLLLAEDEADPQELWPERFIPERERDGIERVFGAFLETGAPQHYRNHVLVRGGEERLVAWENIRVLGPGGEALGCLCLGEDVSEHEQLAENLRESEALYRSLFDLVLEGIVTIDIQGRIESFNASAESIFGYRRDEVVGRKVNLLMADPERSEHDSYLRSYLETGKAKIIGSGRDVIGRRKDGSTFPLHLGVSDVWVGRTRFFAAAVQDLTDQRKVEGDLRSANQRLTEVNRKLLEEQEKLIHAEKLSSIGLLASGVAHEINNPLMGVIGCVRALGHDKVSAESRDEYFETVHDGLERIRVIVAGLLDYARQRPPSAVSLKLSESVRASLRLLNPALRAKDVQVANAIAADAPSVRADRTQLMQALVNILVNAIQAVPRRGRIEIDVEHRDGRVGVRIRDNGPGIPAEHLRRVCDPFFTTKPDGEGTGLGLSVTLGIARAHGGDLVLESPPGSGAVVTLWLPPGDDS